MIMAQSRMAPYIEARDLFIRWCSEISESIPIEFGSIGCPGVSDIDIGVVFNKRFNPQSCDLPRHLKRFPEKVRTLMNGGTLMFFPHDMFKNILYIDDIKVNCLQGAIDLVQTSSEEKLLVDLVQIIEWLPERMAKIYLELKSEVINRKRLVGFFYSLCYSLDKIQTHTGSSEALCDFIKQAHSLRNRWFFLDDGEIDNALKELSSHYFSVILEAINKITPMLAQYFESNISCLEYNIYGDVSIVASDTNIGVRQGSGRVSISVPAVFLYTYLAYSRHNSRLGSIIAKRIRGGHTGILAVKEMNSILNHRIYLYSHMFDFVKSLGCGSGLYKFGWYINE